MLPKCPKSLVDSLPKKKKANRGDWMVPPLSHFVLDRGHSPVGQGWIRGYSEGTPEATQTASQPSCIEFPTQVQVVGPSWEGDRDRA